MGIMIYQRNRFIHERYLDLCYFLEKEIQIY